MENSQGISIPVSLTSFMLFRSSIEVFEGYREMDGGELTGSVGFSIQISDFDDEQDARKRVSEQDIFIIKVDVTATTKNSSGEEVLKVQLTVEANFSGKDDDYSMEDANRDKPLVMELIYPLIRQAITRQIQIAGVFEVGPPWSMRFDESDFVEIDSTS